MITPSVNPLFISNEIDKDVYKEIEYSLLSDTEWLWRDLTQTGEVHELWRHMHYQSLASFFTEIAMCYAFCEALRRTNIDDTRTILFHGNNVVIRIGSR